MRPSRGMPGRTPQGPLTGYAQQGSPEGSGSEMVMRSDDAACSCHVACHQSEAVLEWLIQTRKSCATGVPPCLRFAVGAAGVGGPACSLFVDLVLYIEGKIFANRR